MQMKTYVLILSDFFPSYHPKAGKPTDFKKKLEDGLKKHTFRGNPGLWEHRAEEINAGRAVLSIRQWCGKPRRSGSHQIEIARYTRLGIQRASLPYFFCSERNQYIPYAVKVKKGDNVTLLYNSEFARNDGLSLKDFLGWFSRRKEPVPDEVEGVILHFTDMRY